MDGMQPDECTPEVSWEVAWKSDVSEEGVTRVTRRSQEDAVGLVQTMTQAGFQPKLYRIERTEVDF